MSNNFQKFLTAMGKELFNTKTKRKIRNDFKGMESNPDKYNKKEGGPWANIDIRDKK